MRGPGTDKGFRTGEQDAFLPAVQPRLPGACLATYFTLARVMSGRHPRKETDSRAADLGTAVSRTGAVDPGGEGRNTMVSAERLRLDEADTGGVPRRRWGPYLSERHWGTVREDYGSIKSAASGRRMDAAR